MRFLITTVLLLTLTLGYSQKSRIIKNDSLKYKSVQLITDTIAWSEEITEGLFIKATRPMKTAGRATACIIKYKKKYFLLSNYHVLTGRVWEDTARLSDNQPTEWNRITVTLYSKNDNRYENVVFPLHDQNGNRTYLSLPVNPETRRVTIDIALIPLDTIPGTAIISPISIPNKIPKWEIKPMTKLFCYGYSKRTWRDVYPFCDTLETVADSSFNNKDYFISVYNPPNMHGSSGSPVFLQDGKKYKFIGIQFAVVAQEFQHHQSHYYDFLFPGTDYTNPIGFIITVDYLKQFLDLILEGK
jgi:hypothetical protein